MKIILSFEKNNDNNYFLEDKMPLDVFILLLEKHLKNKFFMWE